MNYENFIKTLKNNQYPTGLSESMQAMWYAKKGAWDKAHQIAQNITTNIGSWIHAYLHRVERDNFNANYWYNKANIKPISTSFDEEAKQIILHIID